MAKKHSATCVCTFCQHETKHIEFHHWPIPESEGGTEIVPVCHKCHIADHSAKGDFERWGRKGGQKTASNPANWMRNLKQFRPRFA